MFEQRRHDDPRTMGTLLWACCEEMKDLSLSEAMHRLLSLTVEQINSAGVVIKSVSLSIVNKIMSTAVAILQSFQGGLPFSNRTTATYFKSET